jgi:hypothetical protein
LVVQGADKWIDVIYDGKSFTNVIEMSAERIRTILESKEISEIVDEEFIRTFDLSIQEFQPKRLFASKQRFVDIQTLFEINDVTKQLHDEVLWENFIDTILEHSNNKKFISIDNFCFSKDRTKVATKDFRILIDDLSGKIPKDEMLHVATIASLMLAGKFNIVHGYDYIMDIMKKYGYTSFSYQGKGYLHVSLGNSQNTISYKDPGRVKDIPKL